MLSGESPHAIINVDHEQSRFSDGNLLVRFDALSKTLTTLRQPAAQGEATRRSPNGQPIGCAHGRD